MKTTLHRDGLVFYRDLTPFPRPLKAPSATSPHILIIGGGVTGLVNAWTLLDQGYRVTILAKEWASYTSTPRLTSQIAGALWEIPPAVCGQHTDAISLQHSKRWCMVAYHIWDAMASIPTLSTASGVRMKGADFFFPVPIEEDAAQMAKMLEIMNVGVRGFRRDAGIIGERRVSEMYGAVDAYEVRYPGYEVVELAQICRLPLYVQDILISNIPHVRTVTNFVPVPWQHLAPIVDTDVCMAFLMRLVKEKGAKLITRTIKGDLFHQEMELREEFGADVIINCTGLAGTEIAGDSSCYPIRGGLIRVINDGKDFPKVGNALTITADAVHDAGEIVFFVPRNDNILLIGGIAESHRDTLDLTLESPIIKRMRARCEAFLPDLKKARLDPEYPFAQGLRPFRQRNVRVERELRSHTKGKSEAGSVSRIVHSYGQGGAGWSLSFGCAGDVLALVEEALLDLPPRPMMLEVTSPSEPAGINMSSKTLDSEDFRAPIRAHL